MSAFSCWPELQWHPIVKTLSRLVKKDSKVSCVSCYLGLVFFRLILACLVLPCLDLSLSCLASSCLILPCLLFSSLLSVVARLVLSCLRVSCLVLPCLVFVVVTKTLALSSLQYLYPKPRNRKGLAAMVALFITVLATMYFNNVFAGTRSCLALPCLVALPCLSHIRLSCLVLSCLVLA